MSTISPVVEPELQVGADDAALWQGEKPSGDTRETIKREGRAYYPALDGLRAFAFLLVFAMHYLDLPWGWSGVDIFFVLSGFLITTILVGSRDDRHRTRNFYVRRTLRIFPLYYLVLAILFVTAWVAHLRLSSALLLWPLFLGNWIDILAAVPHHLFTLAPSNAHGKLVLELRPWFSLTIGHLWSLCVEEQFYLIWPFVVFRLRNRRALLAICLTLIVLCPLGRRFVVHDLAPLWAAQTGFLYSATPMRLDAFMWGALLALWDRGGATRWLRRAARMCLAGGVVVILWNVIPGFLRAMHGDPYNYPGWQFTWGTLVVDVLSFCLLVEALQPSSIVYRVFTVRPMRWLGRISYGAYIFHDIGIDVYHALLVRFHLEREMLAVAALALGLTVAVAWLSFRFFESPFLRLKQRWAS